MSDSLNKADMTGIIVDNNQATVLAHVFDANNNHCALVQTFLITKKAQIMNVKKFEHKNVAQSTIR